MVAAGDEAEAAGLGAPERDKEALVRLLIDERIGCGIGAEQVPVNEARAVFRVAADVIEVLAVRTPQHVARGLVDAVGEIGAAGCVADSQGVIFRTGLVCGPGIEPVVGRLARIAELEIGLARGERVAVEKDGLARYRPRRTAADERVLATLAEAGEIGIGSVDGGHRGIVLLDAPAHLPDQLLAQVGMRREPGLRMGVLGFQPGADVGRQQLGLAHHVTPVFSAKPGVGVGQCLAVKAAYMCGMRRLVDAHELPSWPSALKERATPFMQKRCPVGRGPSGKTWPRWASQVAQRTSTRCMP